MRSEYLLRANLNCRDCKAVCGPLRGINARVRVSLFRVTPYMDPPAHETSDLTLFEEALRTPDAIDHRASGIRNIEIQPGMNLLSVDLRVTKPAVVESRTFPAVCLGIVLDGYAEGRTTALDTGFRPAEVWVASTNDRIATRKVISPIHPVRTVELVLTPEWFAFAEARFGDDPAFDGMRLAVQHPTVTRRRSLDAKLKEIAWAIQHPPGCGVVTSIFLESRSLDLLALLAAEFQEGRALAYPALPRSHAFDGIVAVREKIDRDPSVVLTIAALAAEFAISPSKLKQDFLAAFGIGLGRYIVERRLLLGRELIEMHSISVSEAAYRIGYAHPANFTAAFRRHFGYPPSTLKRFS